ncbi:hypothetical protein [Rhodococcus sp. A14]|uniref:hypothetical protein n=1 Tax=Rhodococcus sp. A14 TaxID=1194106 RepID=UPI001F0B4DB3|nr:hypothetical protein [Rhodococcus opacus]UUK33926.1 hypothetical protein MPY17_40470 [Rhodococcus opacus]
MPFEPRQDRSRRIVSAGLRAGDQRAVAAAVAAEGKHVLVRLAASAVVRLAWVAAVVEMQPDGGQVGAVRDEVPTSGGFVTAARANQRSGSRWHRHRNR